MAPKAVTERGICIRVACQAFCISESCYRYERKLDADNAEVASCVDDIFIYGEQLKATVQMYV